MKKFIITFIAFTAIGSSGYAQSIFSGTENGIGLRQYMSTTRGLGMGGIGLALRDSISLNPQNFASWRYIKNTRINISARYDHVNTEVFNQNFSSRNGNFNGLQLAVPLKSNQFFLGGSITPYSLINFGFTLNYDTGDQTYEENVFYEGNISKAHIGLIWATNSWLSLSAGLNYFFGSISDRYYLFFDDPAISDDFYEIKYQFQGPGIGSSIHLNFLKNLYIGGFIDLKPNINFTRNTLSSISFEEEKEEIDTSFPLFMGIGGSYQFHSQWIVSSDFAYQNWDKSLDDKKKVENLETFYHIGIGIEHAHSDENKRSFLNKFDTRLGFSTKNVGYLFQAESVREYAGHFGLGFPFFQNIARFDIAFIAGIRGEKEKTIAEETFFRTVITLSAGELWFQKIR
jgi:hypothetical protein